jgi:hypothetical protein
MARRRHFYTMRRSAVWRRSPPSAALCQPSLPFRGRIASSSIFQVGGRRPLHVCEVIRGKAVLYADARVLGRAEVSRPPCNMKIRYKMKTTLSGCSGRSRFLQLPLGSRYWLPMLKNSLPGGPKLIASDPHFLERLPQTEIVRCNDISLCHRA